MGDPTVGSNLPPCTVAIEAAIHAIKSPGHAAGYVPACGTWEARCAIAQHHSTPNGTVLPDDVIIANGCSGALELVLTALLDEDSILLVPMPGFPLYQVICESHGASVAHYNLDAANNWEIDLPHLDQLMNNEKVKGIVINNPSNPTGSVYSKQHLKAIFQLCERRGLPIIADEIYGDLVFGANVFTSMAEIMFEMGRTVPVIVTSGLAKQYLVPGWRVGWAVFYDRCGHLFVHQCSILAKSISLVFFSSYFQALQPILEGAKRLAQVILGASHLAQSVIPALLTPSTVLSEWRLNLRQTLESRALVICQELSKCHGLTVYTPQGSMYAIVKIDLSQFAGELQDDVEFTKKLLQEENVFVLPGQAFHYPGVFRVVYCASPHVLIEASRRINDFCQRHRAINQE